MFGLCAQVPEHINDKYFARVKAEAKAKKEGDIFEAKKEEYKPSEERKKDQVEVDKQVCIVPDHIVPYLSSTFTSCFQMTRMYLESSPIFRYV
jgi:hypothetical protein